jgi:hypothetical protein
MIKRVAQKFVSVATALCMVPAVGMPAGVQPQTLADAYAQSALVQLLDQQDETPVDTAQNAEGESGATTTSADSNGEEGGDVNDNPTATPTATSTTEEGAPAAIAEGEDDDDDDGANDTTAGAFTVTGGVKGVDWDYTTVDLYYAGYGNAEWATDVANNKIEYVPGTGYVTKWSPTMLVIKTSKRLTISTTSTSTTGIYISPGIQAELVFDGVNISTNLPLDIATNKADVVQNTNTVDSNISSLKSTELANAETSLYLILADGSENVLNATLDNTLQFPAIRCGAGSNLTIDDQRENIDSNGSFVAPEQGRISRTCTLKDGTEVKEGDRLTKLDSSNPGSLTVTGGKRASAIGGGALEDSGNMTFNGGIVTATAYGPEESRYGAGAGIGGGHGSGGTTMTFNGGTITATGSYHGAGIGAGCTYIYGMSNQAETTYALTDAILTRTPMHTIAGDININGGFLTSTGKTHGNAFGQGCCLC